MNNRVFRIIGAPTDVGGSMLGASLGPDTLRVSGIVKALGNLGHVIDEGNVFGPSNPEEPPVDGTRNFEYVMMWNERVYPLIKQSLQKGQTPVLLGGDHCLALGSISAVSQYCDSRSKTLLVIWLDAHADINTPSTSLSGNMHGMPLAYLTGLVSAKGTSFEGNVPIRNHKIIQIGLRSLDEKEMEHCQKVNIRTITMAEVNWRGMRTICEEVQEAVGHRNKLHVHVSFDVDFLDPSYAPGVSTAVMGGPSYNDARMLMECLANIGVDSLDVMETNPINDVRNKTGKVVVDLVSRMFGKNPTTE